jgi:hypothetical protein
MSKFNMGGGGVKVTYFNTLEYEYAVGRHSPLWHSTTSGRLTSWPKSVEVQSMAGTGELEKSQHLQFEGGGPSPSPPPGVSNRPSLVFALV